MGVRRDVYCIGNFKERRNKGVLSKILIAGVGACPSSNMRKATSQRTYKKATYVIEEKEYKTEFIFHALIQHYQPERVYLLGTAKSMWERVYETFIGDELDYDYYDQIDKKIQNSCYNDYHLTSDDLQPINQTLDSILKQNGSKCLLIKYGLNNTEILKNFNVFQEIANEFQSGDQIFLDITHSFRSLALFQYTMINFIENLSRKSVEVKGVFYGMLDIQSEMGDKTPVVDLKDVYLLNHWIKAIYELEHYGNGYLLANLLDKDNKKSAKKIRMFSDLMNINYLGGIRNLASSLESIDLSTMSAPGQAVSDYLQQFIDRFSNINKASLFQLEMAQWYFENKRYATGYIVLAEATITGICEATGLDPMQREDRDEIKKKLGGYSNSESAKQLNKEYIAVNSIRNNIAHGLFLRDEKNYRNDIDTCLARCNSLKDKLERIMASDYPSIQGTDKI